MKSVIKIVLILSAFVLSGLSCQREITNPFDPECPGALFTPSVFSAEQPQNSMTINLTWEQENTHIEGFKIERKIGNGTWEVVATLSNNAIQWSDKDIVPLSLHNYRLYAYAGMNKSNVVTASETPYFTGVIIKL